VKYFPHETDASRSEHLTQLEKKFGLEGYARWFKILERVAEKTDIKTGKCSATYPESDWLKYLSIRRPLWRCYVVVIVQLFDINVVTNGPLITIEIPKLLINMRNRQHKRAAKEELSGTELELELDKSFNPSKKISDNGRYNLQAAQSPLFFENEKKRKSINSDYLSLSDLEVFRQRLTPEVADEMIRRQEEKRKK
jgi:Domain of unknown function (DUF4373)